MSLESVFAALACYFFIGEKLSWLELVGCAILLSATFLVNFENAEHQVLDEREQQKINGE